MQPLIPAVAAEDGHWLISEPLELILKPGGHGVIWKLAFDSGVFDWFYKKGRKAAIVRQIRSEIYAVFCDQLTSKLHEFGSSVLTAISKFWSYQHFVKFGSVHVLCVPAATQLQPLT